MVCLWVLVKWKVDNWTFSVSWLEYLNEIKCRCSDVVLFSQYIVEHQCWNLYQWNFLNWSSLIIPLICGLFGCYHQLSWVGIKANSGGFFTLVDWPACDSLRCLSSLLYHHFVKKLVNALLVPFFLSQM